MWRIVLRVFRFAHLSWLAIWWKFSSIFAHCAKNKKPGNKSLFMRSTVLAAIFFITYFGVEAIITRGKPQFDYSERLKTWDQGLLLRAIKTNWIFSTKKKAEMPSPWLFKVSFMASNCCKTISQHDEKSSAKLYAWNRISTFSLHRCNFCCGIYGWEWHWQLIL